MSKDKIESSISVMIKKLEHLKVMKAFSKDELNNYRLQKEIDVLKEDIKNKIEVSLYIEEKKEAETIIDEDYNNIYSRFRLNNKNKMR